MAGARLGNFHSFADYDTNYAVRGTIVPQRVYTVHEQHARANVRRLAFLVNGVGGLRLQDALQPAGFTMNSQANIPANPQGGGQRASFRVLWPGYDSWSALNSLLLYGHTRNAPPRTIGDIVQQCARLLHEFWTSMQAVQGGDPQWDLSTIPFNQLYLIELRIVSQGSWQPVISRLTDPSNEPLNAQDWPMTSRRC